MEGFMKKRIIACALSVILALSLLAGCSQGTDNDGSSTSASDNENSAAADGSEAEETEEKKEKLSGKERGRTGIVPWIVKAMLVPALPRGCFGYPERVTKRPLLFLARGIG